MINFFRFMAGTTGRWTRGVVGLGLLAWGYNFDGPRANIPIMAFSMLPILTAVFDLCPIARMFGYPIKGSDIVDQYGEVGTPGEV